MEILKPLRAAEKLNIKPVNLNKIESVNLLWRVPDPVYDDILEPFRIIVTNERGGECAYITADSAEIDYFPNVYGMIMIQPELSCHRVTYIPCDGFACDFPLYKHVKLLVTRREILAVYETNLTYENFNDKEKMYNMWNDLGLFDSYENIINKYR